MVNQGNNHKTLQTKQVLDNIGHGGISFLNFGDTAILLEKRITNRYYTFLSG